MKWIRLNIADVCMVFGLFSAIFVLVSWAIGYYANGLFGYHFDLSSCWAGISAMGVGLVGIFRWLIDSKWNTGQGQSPGQQIRRDV